LPDPKLWSGNAFIMIKLNRTPPVTDGATNPAY